MFSAFHAENAAGTAAFLIKEFNREIVSNPHHKKAQIHRGDGEKQTVSPVEDAAVAGNEVGKILYADHALQKGLRKIADLPHESPEESRHQAHAQGHGISGLAQNPPGGKA